MKSEVRQMLSKSADNTDVLSSILATQMSVQPPEQMLSRKAGIVRCYTKGITP